MKLLVTGGTGLVGNALQKICPDATYLSSKDYDLTKEPKVKAMFKKHRCANVIHLAARVGGIIENVSHPAELYYQNTLMNTYVIHYAYKYGVEKLIALLSNCAYPDRVNKYPINENQLHDGPPAITNFAYAYSKRALEAQIEAYRSQYGCKYFTVIPCNLYGPHDKFDVGKSHFMAALIRKIYEAKRTGAKTIRLMGTGKPLRQYLYVEDLAKILVMLLEKYEGEGPINIAPKENPSIVQIAKIALESTGCADFHIVFDKSSPDGQYRKDISTERLFSIISGFKFTSLSEGIRKTYEWYAEQLDGVS